MVAYAVLCAKLGVFFILTTVAESYRLPHTDDKKTTRAYMIQIPVQVMIIAGQANAGQANKNFKVRDQSAMNSLYLYIHSAPNHSIPGLGCVRERTVIDGP